MLRLIDNDIMYTTLVQTKGHNIKYIEQLYLLFNLGITRDLSLIHTVEVKLSILLTYWQPKEAIVLLIASCSEK